MFRFAACQMASSADKTANLVRAKGAIASAVAKGAQVVCLPEVWNSPYSNDSFPSYAEAAPGGESSEMLAAEAKAHGIFLIGGSIPERDESDGRLYNTCLVYGPQGELLAKHRKVHLFDIDIPGLITFQESKTLSAGDSATSFDTPFGRFGVAICYDVRFPELSSKMARDGCRFLVYPAAFNTTTGPLHWDLLFRSRAVDHQLFVAAVSPSRVPGPGYQAWGHSLVVDPWGKVLASAAEDEEVIVADIDMSLVEDFRRKIPTRLQRRPEVYR